MRGKLSRIHPLLHFHRITPAGAGKTDEILDPDERFGDHPRRCGENPRFRRRQVPRRGSPPQVRGKHHKRTAYYVLHWITPAGAGKTLHTKLQSFTLRDHPRRCGENILIVLLKLRTAGSPPQVRGKPEAVAKLRRDIGITPAGAGKTPMLQASLPAKQDHPRRCGENHRLPVSIPRTTGSPPQVRGKLGRLRGR